MKGNALQNRKGNVLQNRKGNVQSIILYLVEKMLYVYVVH